MKTKKIAVAIFALAMLVFALAPSAFADDTVTTINLTGGLLTLQNAPEGFSFDGLTVSNSEQERTTNFLAANTRVQDLRNTLQGFSVTAVASDFVGGSGDDSFPASNMKIKTGALVTREDGVVLIGSNLPRLTLTAINSPTAIWTNGMSLRQRSGRWSVRTNFGVVVPAFTPAGTYTSTVTFTLS